jgi:hypothetical protein
MSRTSPITVAATTGPTPKTSVRVVPEARTAADSLFFASRIWASMWRRSARNSAASWWRAAWTAPAGAACPGDPGREGRADVLAGAAGDQVAQHGVQAADDLVAVPAQVAVPLCPDLQDRGVVIGPDLRGGTRAQRRDPDRQGVVGVVLARSARRQQPYPRAELGLHVQDALAGGDQLLGQQVPHAAGALDRPGPLRPGGRPREQALGLGRAGAHPDLAQHRLRLVDHHRRVRALMRIDADHHSCHGLPFLLA